MDTIKTDEQTEPETQPAEETTTREAATAKDPNPQNVPAVAGATSSDVLTGGAAVVGAGLGIASLTGTWLGTVMSARQELIGQIKSQSAPPADQLAALYGTPWHTTAAVNGLFALIAILVAAIVLLLPRFTSRPSAAPWAKAVAWGALTLGAIGLLIAGAVWFDIFTALPAVPSGPAAPTG